MGDTPFYDILVQHQRVLIGQWILQGDQRVFGAVLEFRKLLVHLLPAIVKAPSKGLIVEGIVIFFDLIREKLIFMA